MTRSICSATFQFRFRIMCTIFINSHYATLISLNYSNIPLALALSLSRWCLNCEFYAILIESSAAEESAIWNDTKHRNTILINEFSTDLFVLNLKHKYLHWQLSPCVCMMAIVLHVNNTTALFMYSTLFLSWNVSFTLLWNLLLCTGGYYFFAYQQIRLRDTAQAFAKQWWIYFNVDETEQSHLVGVWIQR